MTKFHTSFVLCVLLLITLLMSCRKNYTPKPYGYYRIDFPEKEYIIFDSTCPYIFEYPVYGKIISRDESLTEPCWINISFQDYKGKLHLSYKEVDHNLDQLTEDSRTLAYKHAIKADAIDEKTYFNSKHSVYGILYEIKGNAASSVQFFMTDSTRHFLRGALYFDTRPNKDSLAPVIEFFEKDILHIIETLEWK